MESAFGLALVILICGVCITVLLVLVERLFPEIVGRVEELAVERHGRSVLLGFLNSLLLLALSIVVMLIGENVLPPLFGFLAGAILVVLLIGLLLGLAGMASLIGSTLKPDLDSWPKNLWGAAAMVLASLTPYLGWFLFFPYLLFRGFGGVVMAQSAMRRGRKEQKQVEDES